MNFQSWIPDPVKPLLMDLSVDPACTGHRRDVFDRLLIDPRMEPIYEQFFRLNRDTGDFFYPSKKRKYDQSPEAAQLAALGEILKLTISAASDRVAVSKLGEILDARRRWSDDANRIRTVAHDLALAADLGMLGLNDPQSVALARRDLLGLIHAANWLDHLVSTLRQADDPLVVKKDRGDRVVRAVQTLIGINFQEEFGQRFDGMAATLAGVALGAYTSPRASRSALTARKPPKKRSAR